MYPMQFDELSPSIRLKRMRQRTVTGGMLVPLTLACVFARCGTAPIAQVDGALLRRILDRSNPSMRSERRLALTLRHSVSSGVMRTAPTVISWSSSRFPVPPRVIDERLGLVLEVVPRNHLGSAGVPTIKP